MTALNLVLVGNDTLTRECGLQALDAGHVITAVVTRDPGVQAWAEARGLIVEAPGADLAVRLGGRACDWLLSIANLDLLPADLLTLPSRGAVNFHDGPLPRYAGLNAPVWALLNGEARHGITWHRIEAGVDAGDILVQRHVEIAEKETALSLNLKCYAAALETFPDVLRELAAPRPAWQPQDLSQRSLYRRDQRPPAMGQLRFDMPARDGLRLIRALDHGDYANPLWTPKLTHAGQVIAVGGAEAAEGQGTPGEILALTPDTMTVAFAEGALCLSRLRHMTGGPVTPERLAKVGDRLEVLGEAHLARLTTLGEGIAVADPFWRERFATLVPVSLPVTRTGEGGVQSLALEWPATLTLRQKACLTASWAAQAAGVEASDIALLRPDTHPGFALAWSPFRAGEDPAEMLARLAPAADIALRTPGCPGLTLPDVAFDPQGDGTSDAALTVTAEGQLHVDTARIPLALAQILADRLAAMAKAVAEGKAPPRMSEAERDLVLHGWNDTATDHDAATIHALIEAQAERTPDATALVIGPDHVTYAELNARANRVAHQLRAMGVGPGTLVGLCTRRNAHMVIGALAILKAGGAYVPMDPAYPADRLALYLDDSGAPVVLTESALASDLPEGASKILALDTAPEFASAPTTNPAPAAAPEDLAYLIYTSGSTGRPKGVMVEHRNVSNFFAGMDARIGRDTPGTWLAVTSLSFDISVLELFYSLARGYKLVLVNEDDRLEAVASRPVGGMEFSLFYWGNDDGVGRDKYRLLLEGATFADTHGFCAVWTPERHFHAFGGPYPNPSVTGAAVAGVTRNLAVRAGSCVAPLHHTARIAEEWAVIDNLTNGRAGLAIASGWQPDDFVLRPENTPPRNKPAMLRQIEELRRLWGGEPVDFAKQDGTLHAVVTQPRPVSKTLPIWVTTAGNPETWKEAGRIGANVLTHLLGQTVDEVEGKIALYHAALRDAGHDPADFSVTLMLHSYIAETRDKAREVARGPMKDYLRAAAGLIKQYAWAFPAFKRPEGATNAFDLSLDGLSDEEMEAILEFAFQRYFEDSGLFGTVEDAVARVDSLKRIGVTEVACLIDYGIPVDTVLEGLRPLAEVLARCNDGIETDHSIAAQIVRHKVTHLQCTPSMARLLLMSPVTRAALGPVEQLMLGGEPLAGALVDELRSLTDARIENMYGPTETTIWSSSAPATGGEAICNIGTPIANTRMYVLDAERQPVPVGVTGELFIGGAGVTRGYWQRPDLTADRFLPDPFAGGRMYRTGDLARWRADGRLVFVGRADTQVKLRGFRIELGEIEARLEAMDSVTQAVVVVQDGDTLAAFYNGPAAASDLRAALARDLPGFMVPSRFDKLESFPLTPNRKVDRKALAERIPAPPAVTPPPVTAESAPRDLRAGIAGVWQQVLGLSEAPTQGNFFDLGGHSLLAIQVHRALRQDLNLTRLSIADVFGYPTLDALAARAAELDAQARRLVTPVARPTPQPRVVADGGPPTAETRATSRSEAMARRRQMRARRQAGPGETADRRANH